MRSVTGQLRLCRDGPYDGRPPPNLSPRRALRVLFPTSSQHRPRARRRPSRLPRSRASRPSAIGAGAEPRARRGPLRAADRHAGAVPETVPHARPARRHRRGAAAPRPTATRTSTWARCSRAFSRTRCRTSSSCRRASPRWRRRCAGRATPARPSRSAAPPPPRSAARCRATAASPSTCRGSTTSTWTSTTTCAWSAPGRVCAAIHRAPRRARSRAARVPVQPRRHVRRLVRHGGGLGLNAFGRRRALDIVRAADVVLPSGDLVRFHSRRAPRRARGRAAPAATARWPPDAAEAWFRAPRPRAVRPRRPRRQRGPARCGRAARARGGEAAQHRRLPARFATAADARGRRVAHRRRGRALAAAPGQPQARAGLASAPPARDLGGGGRASLAPPAVVAVRGRRHAVATASTGPTSCARRRASLRRRRRRRGLPLRRLPRPPRRHAPSRRAIGRLPGRPLALGRRERALRRRAVPPAAEQASRPRPAGRRGRRCRPRTWPPTCAAAGVSRAGAGVELDPEVYYVGDGEALVIAGYLTDHRTAGFFADLALAPALLDLAAVRATAAGPTSSAAGRRRSPPTASARTGLARLRALKRGLDPQDLAQPRRRARHGPARRAGPAARSASTGRASRCSAAVWATPGLGAAGRGGPRRPPGRLARAGAPGRGEAGRDGRRRPTPAGARHPLRQLRRVQQRLPRVRRAPASACPRRSPTTPRLLRGGRRCRGRAPPRCSSLCMRCGNCEEVCQAGIPHLAVYERLDDGRSAARRPSSRATARAAEHAARLGRATATASSTCARACTCAARRRRCPARVRFRVLRAENDAGPAATCLHCAACVPVCPDGRQPRVRRPPTRGSSRPTR